MANSALKYRQEAGEQVEKDMLAFLLQFVPAKELKIVDVQCIANYARNRAFALFTEATERRNEE